jgi:hypothetical protein
MLRVGFPGSLVPASIGVEVDALTFVHIVFVLADIHAPVMLGIVIENVNAESVSVAVPPLSVVRVPIPKLHPPQAVDLPVKQPSLIN